MRWAGLALAAIVIVVSALTLIFPDQRVAFEMALMNRAGLSVIAALRIAIALILIFAAPYSRAPRIVGAFGVVVFAAGLVTPWFATQRGQAVVQGLIAAGPTVMRINGLVGLALGGLLGYLLWPWHEFNTRSGRHG